MFSFFKPHHHRHKHVSYNEDETVIIIENECFEKRRPRQVLYKTINNQKFILFMDSLASNQKAPIQVGLADSATLQPIPGATSGTPLNTIDDTTKAVIAADGQTVNGVAAGSANLTTVTSWTYTDSVTQQSVTASFTTVTPITVTSVVTPEGVVQVVALGTPVAQ